MSGKQRAVVAARRVRAALLPLALLGAAAAFVTYVHPHYPIQQWLFWRYAEVWGWCGLFALACLSLGNLASDGLLNGGYPLRERLALALPLGVFGFYLLMFVSGIAGIYSKGFAVVFPLLVLALGLPRLWRRARRTWRHLSAARRRSHGRRPWWQLPVLVFGLVGVGMVYFSILSPRNLAYDAHFYHLGLAQQYAVEGRIAANPIGWLPAALPHLSSVLYTWVFSLPHLNWFQRTVGVQHLEFVVFLFTLAAVPALVRRLVPRARSGLAWAALFLFPGILVYDSGLSGAADHITAAFAIPSFLALLALWRDANTRTGVLLAAMLAGAISCKYQGMYLMAGPVLAATVLMVWCTARSLWRHRLLDAAAKGTLRALVAAAVAGLVFTAPLWLRNWLWYGNPVYPYASHLFSSERWPADTGAMFAIWEHWQTVRWTPQGTVWEKLVETLTAQWQFSFKPHDWPKFHGSVPVFGSLFTLSVVVLPFVRGAKRTWGLLVATQLGVFVWFWTMHQDRYLQILLPWMVCVVAATIVLVWRSHWVARVALVILLLCQVVWGGDAYFIPSHVMAGGSSAVTTSTLLAQGYKKAYNRRLLVPGNLFAAGRDSALPQRARVLVHEEHFQLGIGRPVLSDFAGWQYGLRYELQESPAALQQKLTSMGITHILSRPTISKGFDSLGADIRFFDFLHFDTRKVKRVGGFELYALTSEVPSAPESNNVAYLGCSRVYRPGLYLLADMKTRDAQRGGREPIPQTRPKQPLANGEGGAEALLNRAHYAVTSATCKYYLHDPPGFVRVGKRRKESLWARYRARVAPSAPAK